MDKMWLGSGWKMHKTLAEARYYAEELRRFVDLEGVGEHIFVVPPFTSLEAVCRVLDGSPIAVGAQNMHWDEFGPYTGEISPVMIRDCGAQIVELGHSERRASFGETDFTVNRKVLAAIEHDLRPLVCVGETLAEKEAGAAEASVVRQVEIALAAVSPESLPRVMIAYEPVWAIGETGSAAEPEYANCLQGLIRSTIAQAYGEQLARSVPVLYGGSVNLNNAVAFTRQPNIDGLFVGRAAWDVESFINMLRIVERTPVRALS